MTAFGAFARAGDNRVVVVPGDHDAALLFPSVGMRAVAAFDAPADRVVLAYEGFWRSVDGLIHVEHGHQIETRADRFEGWPRPFITRSGRQHLARSQGQRTVQALFDAHEARYPIVDNLADDTAGAAPRTAVPDVLAAVPDGPRPRRRRAARLESGGGPYRGTGVPRRVVAGRRPVQAAGDACARGGRARQAGRHSERRRAASAVRPAGGGAPGATPVRADPEPARSAGAPSGGVPEDPGDDWTEVRVLLAVA